MLASVVSSEIMLKGENRRHFESLLIANMLASLPKGFSAIREQGRILLNGPDGQEQAAKEALTRAFGVDYVAFPSEARADIKDIETAVLAASAGLGGRKIRVDARRADKKFPLTSPEINRVVGSALVDMGCLVDLMKPDKTITIEVLHGRALIYLERFRGPGGLPLGASGRLISLLSGGIDSPAASWMMMKRGCELDFLHLHQSPKNRDVLETKMARLLHALGKYSPRKLRLYAAPYSEFYKKTMSGDSRIELVLFRRFLFHLANALSQEHGYKGVVSGDSVGQVASQTLDNLFASDEASRIPVFRPLAGFNKQEIVDLAMRIGTYAPSIEPYKDCCSLVAHKSPSTRVPLGLAKKAELSMGIDSVVEKTIDGMEVFEF